jgi:death on curing protein
VRRPEPRWLGRLAVDAAHYRQIREHGGAHGVRDEGALESALARPRHRWHHDEHAGLPELAAAHGFGLARNHPYLDGNERVALVALAAFLDLNGVELAATNAEAASAMLAVAAGEMTEAELAAWVAARSRER